MIGHYAGIVICGTDTDVGKTIVSALLVQGLRGTYWKPVQSGLEGDGDTGTVCRLLNLNEQRWVTEAYRFKAPVSPHWAAEQENKLISSDNLLLPKAKSPLIIETAGGLCVPLNRQLLQIDQLKSWQLPVVLVARTGLGTLNHTLLSLEALRARNIDVVGLILNGPPHLDNPKTLEQLGDVKIIGHLPPLPKLNAQALADVWEEQHIGMTLSKLLSK